MKERKRVESMLAPRGKRQRETTKGLAVLMLGEDDRASSAREKRREKLARRAARHAKSVRA